MVRASRKSRSAAIPFQSRSVQAAELSKIARTVHQIPQFVTLQQWPASAARSCPATHIMRSPLHDERCGADRMPGQHRLAF
jgi:hypothetical protein